MDNLSIREGLLAVLIDSGRADDSRGQLDGAHVVRLLRNAEAAVRQHVGRGIDLNMPRPVDTVDDVIISASHNGRVDLFA